MPWARDEQTIFTVFKADQTLGWRNEDRAVRMTSASYHYAPPLYQIVLTDFFEDWN